MSFEKRVEDFVCDKCGENVRGTGYTNHCPKCLWSKHVDGDPGDRANLCGALMEPLRLEGTMDNLVIVHRCTACKAEKRNKVEKGDDVNVIFAKQPAL